MEKENDKKNEEPSTSVLESSEKKEVQNEDIKEPTFEEKLKDTHDKLLRALADSENQRRRS